MQSRQTSTATTLRAAIYCRLSIDRTGEGLAVERQEQDCRRLAADKGWDVTLVYRDNSISAFSGKFRPEYEGLLKSIKNGDVDVVIAWSHDRLNRRPTELERYVVACEAAAVDTYTVKAGHFDLSTPSGRAIARTLAAWASYEVETSTERIKAAKLQSAQSGRFSGGQRPWGYESGRTAIREDEAVIYKEMVHRLLAGDSFSQVAQLLNDRGTRTQHGKFWNSLKVRNLLLHPGYAGIRDHHGTHYPADWPAIIDKETWDDLQLAIRVRAEKYKQGGPGRRRKFLLTGIAHCGVCGKRMNSVPKQKSDGTYYSRYTCIKKDSGNGEGCGKVMRLIAPVDLLVAESIIYRLESYQFDEAVAKNEQMNLALKELVRRQASQIARVKEIQDDYANGELTKTEYQSLVQTAQARLAELTRQVDLSSPNMASGKLPAGHRAREAWQAADLPRRRQIVELLVDQVRIMPSNVSRLKQRDYWQGYKFIPEHVVIDWKA